MLSNLVWSVADTLRGPYAEAEYGSGILPFTVLRRLEGVMEPHREANLDWHASCPRQIRVFRGRGSAASLIAWTNRW